VKAFAWILTAAAVLIGADVFVPSTDASQPTDPTTQQELATPAEESEPLMALHGGSGMPPPPPD
jgi:hypothetical protein